jgi:spermidine synthase
MRSGETIVFEIKTPFAAYQVIDMTYEGRLARVLFTGEHTAAQSGIPTDGNPGMLFDYNQRLAELLAGLKPRRMLLIGGGAYTLPQVALTTLPDIQIDVVEPDAALYDIAQTYFGLQPTDRLRTFAEDGRTFLSRTHDHYDLIVVDAFSGVIIPRSLTTKEALQAIHDHITPTGVYASNIIAPYLGRAAQSLRSLVAACHAAWPVVSLSPAETGWSLWSPQNFVVIAQNYSDTMVSDFLRYEPVVALETNETDLRFDN